MDILTLGKEIRIRREAIGLTQKRLAKLGSLSRQTVQRLEAGTIEDLSFQRVSNLLKVLGLSFDSPSLAARARKHGLWMAAKTSSVSYKGELSSDMLEQTLATGLVPSGFEPHIAHLLDEAAIEVVVMAVEETAQIESVLPAAIWIHISKLAKELGSSRRELWI